MRGPVIALGSVAAWSAIAVASWSNAAAKVDTRRATEGTLFITSGGGVGAGVLPLARTTVRAKVLGFVSRVSVQQTFNNPYKVPLEVVYVFPLPNKAAVGGMTMQIGPRLIKAHIKTRDQARALYDKARKTGVRAALLEQERPNIFTQSVANVLPGQDIHVELVYDVVLAYHAGVYEFVYPMVVGPRYIPGTPTRAPPSGGGTARDTRRVPDASRITPATRRPGTRSGHEVTMTVVFDPGMPIRGLSSPTHRILTKKVGGGHGVRVSLAPGDRVPNRDFVVRYSLGAKRSSFGVFAAKGRRGGHFALLFEPPKQPAPAAITKKELYFVVDTSESMRGEPLSLVKRAMRYALGHLGPDDTFQIIRFSRAASPLAKKPLSNTPANIRRGLSYINGLAGGGDTNMIRGVRAALTGPPSPGRLRVVCFMTDGFIGNESEVLTEVGKHLRGDTRLFSFGVGSSVNRYLLDRMARVGRGDVHYALLAEPAQNQVKAFYERVRAPVLTDISIHWGGLDVRDVSPVRLPDVFAGRPVRLLGRYTRGGTSTITIRGRVAGKKVSYRVPVALPGDAAGDGTLGRLWARRAIRALQIRRHRAATGGVRAAVTRLALAYGLASKYTSLVALEPWVRPEAGRPRVYYVPVELPRGVAQGGAGSMADAARRGAGQKNHDAAEPAAAPEPAPAPAVESMTLVHRGAAPGAWRVAFGVGVGLGVGHGDAESSVASGQLSARVGRTIGGRYALGIEALLRRPDVSLDASFTHFLFTTTRTRMLRGLLDLTLGAGVAVGDGSAGFALSGGLLLPVNRVGFGAGVVFRVDSALMPGPTHTGATSATLGVQLAW